jgi:hypothetical protein
VGAVLQAGHNCAVSVAPLLQVEAAFFRRQMPDLILREGMTLAARVAEKEGKHGIITLAGVPLVAELPDEVSTGDTLKLLVADTRAEKVVMRLVQEQAAGPAAPPTVNITQPDGSQARLTVDEDGGQDGGGSDREQASIALTYETPKLGPVGLRLEIAPGIVRVRAEVRAGGVYEMADDAADALRRQLAARTGRAAEVTVVPRRDHIEAYA